MKLFFALGFLFIFHMHYVFSCECVSDGEEYDDAHIPLILHSNIIEKDSQIYSEQDVEASCWSFIKYFFSKGNEFTPEIKRCRADFFSILPSELIVYIGSFLDPLSIITFTQTCQDSQAVFTINYWDNKCRQEKLQPWDKYISPERVYVANFWYNTRQIEMIKKAALIGHPESKSILRSIQNNTRENKLESTEIYVEYRNEGYFGRKWPELFHEHRRF